MALAAIDDVESRSEVLRLASSPQTEHSDLVERSTLALGLYAHPTPEVRALLLRTLLDESASVSRRSFAAIALGLRRSVSADPVVTNALLDTAETCRRIDLAAACLVAVGARGDPSAADRLLAIVRGKDENLAVFAVEALGRIGPTPGVVDALTRTIDRRISVNVARSATRSLARLAQRSMPETQRRIADSLAAAVAGHPDATVRGWSLLALGRIAGDAATDAAVRARCVETLLAEFGRDRPDLTRSYAVLGLGLALRASPRTVSAKTAGEVETRLLSELTSKETNRIRTALCLAAGLARSRGALDTIVPLARDAGASRTSREFALVGSALIGDDAVIAPIRAGLGDPRTSKGAAIAAAAAARAELASDLVAALISREAGNQVLIAVARAFGRCGDARAVESLTVIARDVGNEIPALNRSYALTAIGRLCGDYGALDRFVEGLNFRASVPSLYELLYGR